MMNKIYQAHPSIVNDYHTRALFLTDEKHLDILAQLVDSTLLRIDASQDEFLKLFADANKYLFKSVCVPPSYVALAKEHCTHVLVCTVVGFPNGYSTIKNKLNEIDEVCDYGVDEIDFVHDITLIKSNNWSCLEQEYLQVVRAGQGKVIKLILETSVLSADEIIKCTQIAVNCGVNVIKTSTGFGRRGADASDIDIIRNVLKQIFGQSTPGVGIKASGGIRTIHDAICMIKLGATRIGTSNGAQFMHNSIE